MTQVEYRHIQILRALTYAEQHGVWPAEQPPTVSDTDALDLLRAGLVERRPIRVSTPHHAPSLYPYRVTYAGQRSW